MRPRAPVIAALALVGPACREAPAPCPPPAPCPSPAIVAPVAESVAPADPTPARPPPPPGRFRQLWAGGIGSPCRAPEGEPQADPGAPATCCSEPFSTGRFRRVYVELDGLRVDGSLLVPPQTVGERRHRRETDSHPHLSVRVQSWIHHDGDEPAFRAIRWTDAMTRRTLDARCDSDDDDEQRRCTFAQPEPSLSVSSVHGDEAQVCLLVGKGADDELVPDAPLSAAAARAFVSGALEDLVAAEEP